MGNILFDSHMGDFLFNQPLCHTESLFRRNGAMRIFHNFFCINGMIVFVKVEYRKIRGFAEMKADLTAFIYGTINI